VWKKWKEGRDYQLVMEKRGHSFSSGVCDDQTSLCTCCVSVSGVSVWLLSVGVCLCLYDLFLLYLSIRTPRKTFWLRYSKSECFPMSKTSCGQYTILLLVVYRCIKARRINIEGHETFFVLKSRARDLPQGATNLTGTLLKHDIADYSAPQRVKSGYEQIHTHIQPLWTHRWERGRSNRWLEYRPKFPEEVHVHWQIFHTAAHFCIWVVYILQ